MFQKYTQNVPPPISLNENGDFTSYIFYTLFRRIITFLKYVLTRVSIFRAKPFQFNSFPRNIILVRRITNFLTILFPLNTFRCFVFRFLHGLPSVLRRDGARYAEVKQFVPPTKSKFSVHYLHPASRRSLRIGYFAILFYGNDRIAIFTHITRLTQ